MLKDGPEGPSYKEMNPMKSNPLCTALGAPGCRDRQFMGGAAGATAVGAMGMGGLLQPAVRGRNEKEAEASSFHFGSMRH